MQAGSTVDVFFLILWICFDAELMVFGGHGGYGEIRCEPFGLKIQYTPTDEPKQREVNGSQHHRQNSCGFVISVVISEAIRQK